MGFSLARWSRAKARWRESDDSEIDLLLRVTSQVPTRLIAFVREKRADASLRLNTLRKVFGLTALQRYYIDEIDLDAIECAIRIVPDANL